MKILHICENDSEGGAARACYRLHEALQLVSVNSQMLVMRKASADKSVHVPTRFYRKVLKPLRRRGEQRLVQLYRNWNGEQFTPSVIGASGLVSEVKRLKPDVVHIHYISAGTMSVREISRISVPVVLTLHDMHFFTGGCHYSGACEKFRLGCSTCPVLGGRGDDLSSWCFSLKARSYNSLSALHIIGLSQWICAEARSSVLLGSFPIVCLRNPISLERFRPLGRRVSREQLGLPLDKKLLLFGAVNPLADRRKGFLELKQALDDLDADAFEIVILGAQKPQGASLFKQNTHYTGSVSDDRLLCRLLSAVDIVTVPSLQENLSNLIVEATACGAWVVAYDIGGNADIIEDGITGTLANILEPFSLREAIRKALLVGRAVPLSERFRDEFGQEKVASRYKSFYEELLRGTLSNEK